MAVHKWRSGDVKEKVQEVSKSSLLQWKTFMIPLASATVIKCSLWKNLGSTSKVLRPVIYWQRSLFSNNTATEFHWLVCALNQCNVLYLSLRHFLNANPSQTTTESTRPVVWVVLHCTVTLGIFFLLTLVSQCQTIHHCQHCDWTILGQHALCSCESVWVCWMPWWRYDSWWPQNHLVMKVPMPAPLWFAANVDSRRQVSDCAESDRGGKKNNNVVFSNDI